MPRRIRTTRTRPRDHEILEDEMTFAQIKERHGIAPTYITSTGRKVWRVG